MYEIALPIFFGCIVLLTFDLSKMNDEMAADYMRSSISKNDDFDYASLFSSFCKSFECFVAVFAAFSCLNFVFYY